MPAEQPTSVSPTRGNYLWQLRTRSLQLGPRTLVMGILNATPDSFSDGGLHHDPQAAIRRGLQMLDEGADIIDIGGESTRPGAESISSEEEIARVLPVIEGILRERPEAILSIDTYHAAPARAAVFAGAEIINDVSGLLWDDAMATTCAELCCGVILMHTRGRPQEWASLPPLDADEVLPIIQRDLHERIGHALVAGVQRNQIVLDPGFGFGKRGKENLYLLDNFGLLRSFDLPLLAGLSRKSFLAPGVSPDQREAATIAANVAATFAGAHIVRVHDVRSAVQALAVTDLLIHPRQ